jgi:ribosome maturation factor RimP
MMRPTVQALGYDLWGCEYLSQGAHSLLRVYIEKESGVSIDDCAIVARQINGVLDVEEPIHGRYNLEVSSPGIDRRLFFREQYHDYIGQEIKVRLGRGLNGRSNFTGLLLAVTETEITLQLETSEVNLQIADIEKATIRRGCKL